MTSLQSEQTSVIQKQSSGWIAKHTVYHLIFTEKHKIYNIYIYIRIKEAKTNLLILASG